MSCICQSCKIPYKIDLMIPDELWEKISPVKVVGFKSGGLLCGSCIMERLEELEPYADYFYFTKNPELMIK